ncbi:hypothetical protein KFE25_012595 [Diacronema lutheri]|uniref:Uncharacterized protein n=1 Tax=Diacronema lutheri TaxID=2081491 RepID=A0A8J6C8A7_DIALT|nr:hypothetical protein KFE25_012595 [Diacronema lutheri]
MGDHARECAAVSLADGRLLTFGGMWTQPDGEIVVTNQTYIFDAARRSWSKLSTTGIVPRARAGHALVAPPGTSLVIAAHGLNCEVGYLADVCVLDVQSSTWTHAGLNGELLSARDKLAAAAYHGRVYFHGGFGVLPEEEAEEEEAAEEAEATGGEAKGAHAATRGPAVTMGWHDDLHEYEVERQRVRRLQPLGARPTARAAHSLVALDVGAEGALFLFGGRTCAGRCNELWKLDLGLTVWHAVDTTRAPAARSFHAACAISPDRFVVFGGLSARDTHLCDLHVFAAATETWEELPARGDGAAWPSPRASCAIGRCARELVVFGGSSGWLPEEGIARVFHNDVFMLPLDAALPLDSAPTKLSHARPDKRARTGGE